MKPIDSRLSQPVDLSSEEKHVLVCARQKAYEADQELFVRDLTRVIERARLQLKDPRDGFEAAKLAFLEFILDAHIPNTI